MNGKEAIRNEGELFLDKKRKNGKVICCNEKVPWLSQ